MSSDISLVRTGFRTFTLFEMIYAHEQDINKMIHNTFIYIAL